MKVNKIIKSTVETELEITGATLLSIEEAEKYLTGKERAYDYCWWLRTAGEFWDTAAYVGYHGDIHTDGGFVDYDCACIRPALQIKNLESSNLKIGDTFELTGSEFKIISENLAWMHKQYIDCYTFNADSKKGNDYKKSDIKKFVDKWFKLLMFNNSEER